MQDAIDVGVAVVVASAAVVGAPTVSESERPVESAAAVVCVDTNTEAVDGAAGDDAELAVPTFRVDSANRWYRDDREIGRLQGPFGTHGTYKVGGTFGHQQSGCGGNLGAILRWGWVSPPSARVVTKGLPRGAVHGIARSTGRHREFLGREVEGEGVFTD